MSRCVWKWKLPLEVDFTLEMPEGAQLLTVQTQYAGGRGEAGALWALVDPDAPLEPRAFRIVGTGARDEIPGPYVGTYQLTGGSFVAHIFEVPPYVDPYPTFGGE